MSLPEPRAGLVIRYSFLWSSEQAKGAQEGTKDRPCAIVVAMRREQNGELTVIVAPITHTEPADKSAAIELAAGLRRKLGLDGERQWLCFDELNQFVWPGYDLRAIPGKPSEYAYGMLPPAVYEQLRLGILERNRSGQSAKPVRRD